MADGLGNNEAVPLLLDGWKCLYSGKVRDLYAPDSVAASQFVLMVSTDRISAFDQVLRPQVPGKGILLTEVTRWWQSRLAGLVHHGVGPEHGGRPAVPAAVAGRAVIAQRLKMIPVECVVRGHLAGAAWAEYRTTGSVGGHRMPAGLAFGDRVPEPVFTPFRKAPAGEHDTPITLDELRDEVGALADELQRESLSIYSRAYGIAAKRGVVLGDTKFEFGREPRCGRLVLGDEILTPDSSRYWRASDWFVGERRRSLDKQLVRDWVDEHWDGASPLPALPTAVVRTVRSRYAELASSLAGTAG